MYVYASRKNTAYSATLSDRIVMTVHRIWNLTSVKPPCVYYHSDSGLQRPAWVPTQTTRHRPDINWWRYLHPRITAYSKPGGPFSCESGFCHAPVIGHFTVASRSAQTLTSFQCPVKKHCKSAHLPSYQPPAYVLEVCVKPHRALSAQAGSCGSLLAAPTR